MSNLADTRELIQNDIICCVESNNEIVQRFPDLLDNLCQIVVDRFKEIEDKHEITVVIEGGMCVDVRGLPKGWDYAIEDYDVEKQG